MSDVGRTRAQVVAMAGTFVGGLLVPRAARAASVAGTDRPVVARLLLLEQLQEAFYTEAERLGALTGGMAAAAETLGGVERAHVTALRELAGSAAPGRQRFDFRGATEVNGAFAATAVALEELTVAASKAQLTRVRSPEVLQAVIGIHSAEGRHAAWTRLLAGMPPAPDAFDEPRDAGIPARFLETTEPRTAARRSPTFPA
jgi:hypothetical protein